MPSHLSVIDTGYSRYPVGWDCESGKQPSMIRRGDSFTNRVSVIHSMCLAITRSVNRGGRFTGVWGIRIDESAAKHREDEGWV